MKNKKNLTEIKIFAEKNKLKFTFLDNIENSKKGRSEINFLKYLLEDFSKNVFVDKSPYIGTKSFEPDFVIFDPTLNLYFDIEIDEPYTLKEGKTIHHNRTKDHERNMFFNNLNWIVIRFSEKQIVTAPQSCSTLIKNIIENIKNRNNILQSTVPIDNFWTHEDALVMQLTNYRDSY